MSIWKRPYNPDTAVFKENMCDYVGIEMGESLILTGTFIQYCSPAQETG